MCDTEGDTDLTPELGIWIAVAVQVHWEEVLALDQDNGDHRAPDLTLQSAVHVAHLGIALEVLEQKRVRAHWSFIFIVNETR